jgi:hypothetical protein
MIRPCALAKVALEACPTHLTTEEALETHASLRNMINIAHNLFARFVAKDASLFSVQSTPPMDVRFAILSGQQIFIVEIIGAQ